MTEMNSDLKKEFDEFFGEAIKFSPEYQLLEADTVEEPKDSPTYTSFESKIESMVWQGFLLGLRKINDYPDGAFKATCVHCGNGITETAEGEIVWCHAVAEKEDWIWDFDNQSWACPDCAI